MGREAPWEKSVAPWTLPSEQPPAGIQHLSGEVRPVWLFVDSQGIIWDEVVTSTPTGNFLGSWHGLWPIGHFIFRFNKFFFCSILICVFCPLRRFLYIRNCNEPRLLCSVFLVRLLSNGLDRSLFICIRQAYIPSFPLVKCFYFLVIFSLFWPPNYLFCNCIFMVFINYSLWSTVFFITIKILCHP